MSSKIYFEIIDTDCNHPFLSGDVFLVLMFIGFQVHFVSYFFYCYFVFRSKYPRPISSPFLGPFGLRPNPSFSLFFLCHFKPIYNNPSLNPTNISSLIAFSFFSFFFFYHPICSPFPQPHLLQPSTHPILSFPPQSLPSATLQPTFLSYHQPLTSHHH